MTAEPRRTRRSAWVVALSVLGAADLVFLGIGLRGPSTCALSIVDCEAGVPQAVTIGAAIVILLVIGGLIAVRVAAAHRSAVLVTIVVLLSFALLVVVATDWLAFGILGDFP